MTAQNLGDEVARAAAAGVPARPEEDRSVDTLDRLTLTGLEVFAHHGVFDFERENGQLFVIDATLWLDTAPASAGDELGRTVHYGELAVEISEAVAGDPVDLIETLAERVAQVVLAHEPVQRVRVVVHKPDAPITVPFTDVSITITRSRPALAQPPARLATE